MVAVEELLAELLEEWEAAIESGLPKTPEEVCRRKPETLAAFRALLTKIGAVNAILNSDEPVEGTAELAGPEQSGRYRVNSYYDRGGQAVIFTADDTELRRTVALKWMPALSAVDPTERDRFVFEAELVAKLDHPGIVPIYGLGEDENGQPFYAMRMIHGENLGDAAKKFHAQRHADDAERNLAFRRLLQHFTSVCATVSYAHARGVVHRDLKPGNVRIGSFGETIVLDWGLAKYLPKSDDSHSTDAKPIDPEATLPSDPLVLAASRNPNRTLPGSIMGSPAYMSPEQAEGNSADVGPATDIYGLGATLYVLLTGRAPFQGNTVGEILDSVKKGRFPKPREVRPATPKALEAICLKAMTLKPQDRYASVVDLAADVEHWLADEPVAAWREPISVRARRWVAKHRTFAVSTLATSAVIILALATTSVLLDRKNRETAAAKQTAEANYEQSHASLLRVVDAAVNGRTFADNAALLPVRLEILDTAVANARGLAARAPDDERVAVELVLLLAARGETQAMLGKTDDAITSLQEAVTLGDALPNATSTDARHARGLARYLLAQSLPGGAQADDLLQLACADLAPLVEENRQGDVVRSFGRRYAPATIFAAALAATNGPLEQRPAWLASAERALAQPASHRDDEMTSQAIRGRLWSREAQASAANDATRAKQYCATARQALERSLAAAGDDDFAVSLRWMLLDVAALEARLVFQEGRKEEAAIALRRVCDDRRSLIAALAAAGARLQPAWAMIDPKYVAGGDRATTPSSRMLTLRLVDDLLALAEMRSTQGGDAVEPSLAEAESLLAELSVGPSIAPSDALQTAVRQVALAERFAKVSAGEARAQRWAEAAVVSLSAPVMVASDAKARLAGVLIYQALEKQLSTEPSRQLVAATLQRAYAILAKLSDTSAEAAEWRRRADELSDIMTKPQSR